jgi:hypothetical protein
MQFSEFEASFRPTERGVHAVCHWRYAGAYLMCAVDSHGDCISYLPFHDEASYKTAQTDLWHLLDTVDPVEAALRSA